MKESVGEGAMTIITIVIVSGAIAGGTSGAVIIIKIEGLIVRMLDIVMMVVLVICLMELRVKILIQKERVKIK